MIPRLPNKQSLAILRSPGDTPALQRLYQKAELHDKVATRLQVPWDNQQFKFNTLEEAKRYMVKLDNSQRIMRESRDRENRDRTSSQDDRARNTKRVTFAATAFHPRCVIS